MVADDLILYEFSLLADNIPLYWDNLRKKGAESCFVSEDWMKKNCSPENFLIHKQYVIEEARESFLRKDHLDIIYTDEPNCSSDFLNDLKKNRLHRIGSVQKLLLLGGDETEFLLDPCKRQQLIDPYFKIRASNASEFAIRRKKEIKKFGSILKRPSEQMDPLTVSAIVAEEFLRLTNNSESFSLSTFKGRYAGHIASLSCELNDSLSFAIDFFVQKADGVWAGNLGISTNLVKMSVGEYVTCNKQPAFELYRPLHMNFFLPGGYSGISSFDDFFEFNAVFCLWAWALDAYLPDALVAAKSFGERLANQHRKSES